MFNWKKKNRLSEQLRFFNATKKRFISCYAKKPRIRVSRKIDRCRVDKRYGRIHNALWLSNLSAQGHADVTNLFSQGMCNAQHQSEQNLWLARNLRGV